MSLYLEDEAMENNKYIEDLEKAFAQIKMENAALVNLIGATVCCANMSQDVGPRQSATISRDGITEHYSVDIDTNDDGDLVINAEPRSAA